MVDIERIQIYVIRFCAANSFRFFLLAVSAVFFCFGVLHARLSRISSRPEKLGWNPVHYTYNQSELAPFYLPDSFLRDSVEGQWVASPDEPAQQKAELNLFVGIFTTPTEEPESSASRRASIRKTFLPSLVQLPKTEVRFVIGQTDNPDEREAVEEEQKSHPGTFLNLNVEDCSSCTVAKAAAFFAAVERSFSPRWVLKLDDSVYVAPSRVPLAMRQWDAMGAGYVGCLKQGAIYTQASDLWHERAWRLVGNEYYKHAAASSYAVSGRVAREVLAEYGHRMRPLSFEDTSVGMWLMAFNVTFFDDKRLCSARCHPHAVAFVGSTVDAFDANFMCKRASSARVALPYMSSTFGGAFDKMQVHV